MLSPCVLTVISRSLSGLCVLKYLGCGRLFRAGDLVFLLWSLAEEDHRPRVSGSAVLNGRREDGVSRTGTILLAPIQAVTLCKPALEVYAAVCTLGGY